jgi:hypothetical protein
LRLKIKRANVSSNLPERRKVSTISFYKKVDSLSTLPFENSVLPKDMNPGRKMDFHN